MLEEYKEGQPVVYRILNNIILNKRYNHAYLFFLMIIYMLMK